MNKTTKIILLSFIGLCVFISVMGFISLYFNVHKTDDCTEEVTGVCSDMVATRKRNSSKSIYYHYIYTPVFEYEYSGKTYKERYGISYNEKHKDTFTVGKEYTIYVNPSRPTQFLIKGHEEDIDTFAIIGPIAGIFMSVIFLLVFFLVDARCKKVREIKSL